MNHTACSCPPIRDLLGSALEGDPIANRCAVHTRGHRSDEAPPSTDDLADLMRGSFETAAANLVGAVPLNARASAFPALSGFESTDTGHSGQL